MDAIGALGFFNSFSSSNNGIEICALNGTFNTNSLDHFGTPSLIASLTTEKPINAFSPLTRSESILRLDDGNIFSVYLEESIAIMYPHKTRKLFTQANQQLQGQQYIFHIYLECNTTTLSLYAEIATGNLCDLTQNFIFNCMTLFAIFH